MESETRRKIEETVLDVLKNSNIDEATEFTVRAAASGRLGMDLSDSEHKLLVRGIVESYLLAIAKQEGGRVPASEPIAPQQETRELVQFEEEAKPNKEVTEDLERFICQLTNKRNVVVHEFRGKKMVSIRDYYEKYGKQLPSARGISLPAEQWSAFKKSVPAIDEAIAKMEATMGIEVHGKQNGDEPDSTNGKQCGDVPNPTHAKQSGDVPNLTLAKQSGDVPKPTLGKQNGDVTDLTLGKQNGFVPDPTLGKQRGDVRNPPLGEQNGDVPSLTLGEQNGDMLSLTLDAAPPEPVPIEISRFDGKNYHVWIQQMESLLKQLKIAYVLTELCPNATPGICSSSKEDAEARASEKRWVNDDFLCRRNILCYLSDHLFSQYANRKMTARELWEELRVVYLYEQFGAKRSQVKKYIEFEFVEEKSIYEQARDLNTIADSVVSSGMMIDENFHVSTIISKLPPSWKDSCIKLMREEYLPFWMLMERLRAEEEYRNGVKQGGGEGAPSRHNNTYYYDARRSVHRGTDTRLPSSTHGGEGKPFRNYNTGYYEARRSVHRGTDMRLSSSTHGRRNRPDTNDKSTACDGCGKKGHLYRDCWYGSDNQFRRRIEESRSCEREISQVNMVGVTE